MSSANSLLGRAGDLQARAASLTAPFALLALRIALAIPFFRSGLTKWDGLNLSTGARYLFTEEFKLHFFWGSMAYPAPILMAHLAAIGEIVLPILLILGLATRPAALGILAMTVIIQLTIPDGLINFHLPWFAMALALFAYGGGLFSADRLLAPLLGRAPHSAATPTSRLA
ncbi:DoxX family protein [Devosia sp.]|uniref:DoxX family protein n=1 Tax=Devosia sp. TaxID=1871048 RepID=UPI003A942B4B